MNQKQTFCKNEMIVGLEILSILETVKNIEIAKVLLISPIYGYKGIIEFLKSQNTQVRSIEELIEKKRGAFLNFNKRYYEDLVLSMNAIMLFKELKLINIDGERIVRTETPFEFNDASLGTKAGEIIEASKKLALILNEEEASDLYLSLRVEL